MYSQGLWRKKGYVCAFHSLTTLAYRRIFLPCCMVSPGHFQILCTLLCAGAMRKKVIDLGECRHESLTVGCLKFLTCPRFIWTSAGQSRAVDHTKMAGSLFCPCVLHDNHTQIHPNAASAFIDWWSRSTHKIETDSNRLKRIFLEGRKGRKEMRDGQKNMYMQK